MTGFLTRRVVACINRAKDGSSRLWMRAGVRANDQREIL
jgi:hypothetical protein